MWRVLTSRDERMARVLFSLPKGGGKRLRPLLVLLSAQCFQEEVEPAVPVAVCAELVHTATLMHDDVVDESPLRRGQPAAHSLWGNKIAILAGDHIFARAIDLLVALGDLRLLRAMSGMIADMGEGEIMQIFQTYDVNLKEEEYIERIRRKTALFLSTCCKMGALVAQAPERQVAALAEYGLFLGLSFQVVDDILDFVSDEKTLGKPAANDLRVGNLTLPVIYSLRQNGEGGVFIREAVAARRLDHENIAKIVEILKREGALEYAERVAWQYADKARRALDELPPSPAREALANLASYVVERSF
ncbi:MAG: polyprenyl synthetase family protein [Bacillota bacterium]|nr:polyprenyl synthetase family protein [Bacillota bacterium]